MRKNLIFFGVGLCSLAIGLFFQNCAGNLSSQNSDSTLSSSGDSSSNSSSAVKIRIVNLPPGSVDFTKFAVSLTTAGTSAPTLSCAKRYYHVGEMVQCVINNADADTVCYQSGTFSAVKQLCTNYGWKYDAPNRQFSFNYVLGASSVGDYLIYAEGANGSSNFDLHYLAATTSNTPPVPTGGNGPSNMEFCRPGLFVDPLLGSIETSGILGSRVKGTSGCGQPFICDSANGYMYADLYAVNKDPLRCSKYRAVQTTPVTWGGKDSLQACRGSAGILTTNNLNIRYSAFSAGSFNSSSADGEYPLLIRTNPSLNPADANTEFYADNSKAPTCSAYYYFNNINPSGYPQPPVAGANSNAAVSSNSYAANICDRMNVLLAQANPNDANSNRCTKIWDRISGAGANGTTIWAVTCKCDSM